MKAIRRMISPAKGSFFLFGPRGTGKSVWLKQRFPNALIISLLNVTLRREMVANPQRLRALIEGTGDVKDIVIDEIQRAPELLDVVHALMDEKRGYRFILAGSSARKLKRNASADLLGGRAVLRYCHPFMASELGEAFSLERALQVGMIPLVLNSPPASPEDVLSTYLDLYLQEEVTSEGVIRNLDAFARFLEAASFSHAQLLSASDVARDAGVKRSTVDGYFSILEDMLITRTLPVFSKRAKRLLVGHDKYYFFDAGVYRALRPKGPLDRPSEIDGACLEGLVFQHLTAWNDYSGGENTLHFWRTRAGVEVDFVVYGAHAFHAIEVKNAAKVTRRDASGLEAFHADYPEATCTLLYRGTDTLKLSEHCLALPIERFLRELTPNAPLPLS